MTPVDLQLLAQNREAILLAEVAALLHDVGKLSSLFVDQMSQNPSPSAAGFAHESAPVNPQFVDGSFLSALRASAYTKLLRLNHVPSNEQIGSALDLIQHHDKPKHSALLVRLLNACDGADSGADKGTTRAQGLPQTAKQLLGDTYVATAFGVESRLDPHVLDTERANLTHNVGLLLGTATGGFPASVRQQSLSNVRAAYRQALAETRRPANDVTLWDHSLSVASLYKTRISSLLLNGQTSPAAAGWRLLRVNFDVLGLYAKAIKVADLLGYQEAVDEACESLKQLVEEEYPLGNEVYRDSSGIYFTFPDIDLPAELEAQIRQRLEVIEPELYPRIAVGTGQGNTATDQLKTMLGAQRQEAAKTLVSPMTSDGLHDWQAQWDATANRAAEVCPVCRLRPKDESSEVCSQCQDRRGSRLEAWKKDPQQTIWLDEIADENGRLALIVGKFGLDKWLSGDMVGTMLVKAVPNDPKQCVPKNASPARLRRIWETTLRFWEQDVEDLLHKLPMGTRWSVTPAHMPSPHDMPNETVCDGEMGGRPISLWRQGEAFLTISSLAAPPRGRLRLSWEVDGRKQRAVDLGECQVQQASSTFSSYKPWLRLLASPDQYLALVPANKALDLTAAIYAAYERECGKVRNRLPLFIGLVYFARKLPLQAVMDMAHRMLAQAPLGKEPWTVRDAHKGTVSFKESAITWTIPTMMGDGKTEDVWYPYVQVEGDPGQRSYRFQWPQDSGTWHVHVRDLHAGDRVIVWPSRFRYVYLEQTGERFGFDPQDVMFMEEVQRMRELWAKLHTPTMTDTALRGIQELFAAKGQEWRLARGQDDETFRHLVETTLRRQGIEDAVSVDDVMSGRFERCLDIYLRIHKERIKKEDGR